MKEEPIPLNKGMVLLTEENLRIHDKLIQQELVTNKKETVKQAQH